jgi:hypothetical protein
VNDLLHRKCALHDLIVALDHLPPETRLQNEVEAHLAKNLLALLPGRQRLLLPIQLPLLVSVLTFINKRSCTDISVLAAAAARINAQIQSKRGVQHVDVPPIRTSSAAGKDASPSGDNINGEVYIADGDYIKDIEVNDLRNRYTLTKGSTQKMVNIPTIYIH